MTTLTKTQTAIITGLGITIALMALSLFFSPGMSERDLNALRMIELHDQELALSKAWHELELEQAELSSQAETLRAERASLNAILFTDGEAAPL